MRKVSWERMQSSADYAFTDGCTLIVAHRPLVRSSFRGLGSGFRGLDSGWWVVVTAQVRKDSGAVWWWDACCPESLVGEVRQMGLNQAVEAFGQIESGTFLGCSFCEEV